MHRLMPGIEREQLLGMRHAAQRIASHRNQAAPDVPDFGKRRRYQNRLVDRAAHRRDAAGLVDRRADDGKVQPFAASDIAIDDFADMQAEIHVGDGLALRCTPFFEFGDGAARGNGGGQRRVAGVHAVFGGKNGKRTVADQLEHVAAMLVDGQEDRIGIVVEQ